LLEILVMLNKRQESVENAFKKITKKIKFSPKEKFKKKRIFRIIKQIRVRLPITLEVFVLILKNRKNIWFGQ